MSFVTIHGLCEKTGEVVKGGLFFARFDRAHDFDYLVVAGRGNAVFFPVAGDDAVDRLDFAALALFEVLQHARL